ncbi:MAG TPA: PAS domain S-box protein [Desulfuromonadales bacterium]|nr:PAS domain S-box protein [Desulfuromonadales bacterium]
MTSRIRLFLFGSLRRQLIVGVAAVHAVLMTLFIADIAQKQKAAFLDYQLGHAVSLVNSLATSSASGTASHDIVGLQELVDAQTVYQELKFAIVTDVNGMVLAHTDHARVGQHLLDMPTDPLLKIISNSLTLVDVATPVLLMKHHVGWIRIGIAQTGVTQKLNDISRKGLLFTLVTILTGSLLAWVMGRQFTKRLYVIKSVMEEVQAGNTAVRSDVSGSDEAADLSAGFNSMLDKLAQQIVERTAAIKTLCESEGKYRLLFESAGDAIFIHDAEGHFLAVNSLACERLGYSHAELMSVPLGKLDTPEQSWCVQDRVAHLMEHGRHTFETAHQRKDGSSVPTEVSARKITWDGQPAMMSICRDISERKLAEVEIHQLNNELEQRVTERTAQLKAANQEMESFAYSVSHDLRAPLRSIDGFSLALLEDCGDKLDGEGKDYLRRVRAATQKMAQLIDDILKLSRVTRAELTSETVNLSTLTVSIAEELRRTDQQRKVEFVIKDDAVTKGDPRLLTLVLENLLGNAWKFTSGHAEARIEFGISASDGKTAYFVRDDGAGFDMKYVDKLFTTFQRLHTELGFPGTGVGLTLVQHIIHRHGGTIWAEGAVDQGATFWFTLG